MATSIYLTQFLIVANIWKITKDSILCEDLFLPLNFIFTLLVHLKKKVNNVTKPGIAKDVFSAGIHISSDHCGFALK